jgi:hypothetical protein
MRTESHLRSYLRRSEARFLFWFGSFSGRESIRAPLAGGVNRFTLIDAPMSIVNSSSPSSIGPAYVFRTRGRMFRVRRVMRKHRQPGLHLLENRTHLFRVRVMLGDGSSLPPRHVRTWDEFVRWPAQQRILLPRPDFVDQHVGTLRELDQIPSVTRRIHVRSRTPVFPCRPPRAC